MNLLYLANKNENSSSGVSLDLDLFSNYQDLLKEGAEKLCCTLNDIIIVGLDYDYTCLKYLYFKDEQKFDGDSFYEIKDLLSKKSVDFLILNLYDNYIYSINTKESMIEAINRFEFMNNNKYEIMTDFIYADLTDFTEEQIDKIISYIDIDKYWNDKLDNKYYICQYNDMYYVFNIQEQMTEPVKQTISDSVLYARLHNAKYKVKESLDEIEFILANVQFKEN